MMDAAAPALQTKAKPSRAVRRLTPMQIGALLVMLAIGLRLAGLAVRPLWLDEAYSAWFSEQGWQYLWSVVPTYETHPPFYYSLLKLWREAFGDGTGGLRSLSVALSTLTVPIVIASAFAQERLSPSGRPMIRAAAAGFLAACSPVLVMLGQEARPYPLLIFAYALAILGLLRLMREFADGGPGQWSSWTLLGAGAELSLWAHALGLLYGFCLAVSLTPAWLKRPRSRPRLVRGTLVCTAVVLAYLPCLRMMLGRSGDWSSGWLSWRPAELLQLVGLYSVPTPMANVLTAAAAFAMLLLFKRAAEAAFDRRGWNSDRALLLLWFGPTILAALISAFAVPVFLLRTLAATLVPAYLAMSGALSRTPSRGERNILGAAIALAMLPAAWQMAMRPAPEAWDVVASHLSSKISAKDQVWLYPSDSALPLAHVSPTIASAARPIPSAYPAVGTSGIVRSGSPAVISVTREQAERLAADPALGQVPVIWLVTRQRRIFDPGDDLPSALARARRPGKMQEWGYIAVQPFYRAGTP
jgi:uncharacterized membrane protein